jgi:hypothetical protein
MGTDSLYTEGGYLSSRPEWHVADSPWKADRVQEIIGGWRPATVCEVGCGAGAILRTLHDRMPDSTFVGYEISPQALELAQPRATDRLTFRLQDPTADSQHFELMLIMDVIEHVPDPIGFLAGLRGKADRAVLHIPLDLSAQSVLRPGKLCARRRDVGHIHYFTPETAVATVEDAGYSVTDTAYTRGFHRPQMSRKAKIASLPRRWLPTEVTVRLLGGYSLLVAAESACHPRRD